MMYDYLVKLSGNSLGELMDYFLKKSKFGKDLTESVRNKFRMLRMTLNIQALHQSLDKYSDQKSNVLALVADTHTRKEIRDMGFKVSNTQYAEAKRKAEDGMHSLNSKCHKANHSFRVVTENTKEVILSYFLNSSRSSSNTSLSTPCARQASKKPKKRVDMCPICTKGEQSVKRLARLNLFEANKETKRSIEYEIDLYKDHLSIKDMQSAAYKACLDRLISNDCVVVMDFKENFKVDGGPVEIGARFYTKSQISDLGFAAIYIDSVGKKKYKYFNYMSEILSHNPLYVSDCLSDLFRDTFFGRFNRIHLWSDSRPHFRLQELLYSVFINLTNIFNKIFTLNYFTEYHKKSVVDGHFGCLSRWLA
ncbi:hypothetical protein BB558_002840 [Smittium angustum]|uniref:Uncharacterized protein n=1 Tax=Smittium angustum TaxID=133377 RepID=A0A2U1J7T1_SMIAN|nr:hypothetical protein BB558_002840 [Smittium angustum]